MSLLSTPVTKPLSGSYNTKLVSFKEVSNNKGGYIELVLALEGREKHYTYCIFPSQIEYVTSALASQLDVRDTANNLSEVLEAATQAEFTTYFTWNKDLERLNVAFHEAKHIENEEAIEL